MLLRNSRPRQTPAADDRLGVLVADADPLARIGLHSLVEREPDWRRLPPIEEARCVLLSVTRLRPHVLLLDSEWDRDGTLVHALSSQHPELSVILLARPAHQHREQYAQRAREAGALAILPRNNRPTDLLRDIRQAVSGANLRGLTAC